jgi:outer membrane immunogenic protein
MNHTTIFRGATSIMVIALGAGVATAAFAQDPFVGPRIEAHAGWDHGDVPDLTGSTAGTAASSDRMIYGVGLGYDWSLGRNVVAGVEGNADFGGHTGCVGSVNLPSDQLCGKMVRDLDVGARLGVVAGPVLLYGRVAYASTLANSSYTLPSGVITAASNTSGAARIGAGIEYALTPNVYAKTEYRYTTSGDLSDRHQVLAGLGFRF